MAGEKVAAAAKSKSGGGLFDNLRNSLFSMRKDVVLDIQSGAMGVKVKNEEGEAIVTLTDGKLVHNPIKQFGLPVPGIALRTQVADLRDGDILVMPDGGYSFVLGKGEGQNPGLNIINAKSGRTMDFNPPQNTLLGNAGVLAIRNVFNFGGNGGGEGGGLFGGGMNPLMLMLLLGDKDGGEGGFGGLDTKTLLLFSMMQGQQGGQGGQGGQNNNNPFSNPLMLLLLLGDKDKDGDGGLFGGDGLQTILMMQMMGGGGGACGNMLFPLLFAKSGCCKGGD